MITRVSRCVVLLTLVVAVAKTYSLLVGERLLRSAFVCGQACASRGRAPSLLARRAIEDELGIDGDLLAEAESGDIKAQYAVGSKLGEQITVESRREAAIWLGKAAEAGEARAQHELGMLILDGIGVPENPALAAQWISAAATQGLVVSQHQMGMMLYRGVGVAVNHEWAVYWFQQAASQESLSAPITAVSEAQYALGLMYLTGEGGLEASKAKAAWWFERSSERGNRVAFGLWQKIQRGGISFKPGGEGAGEYLQWTANKALEGPKQ